MRPCSVPTQVGSTAISRAPVLLRAATLHPARNELSTEKLSDQVNQRGRCGE